MIDMACTDLRSVIICTTGVNLRRKTGCPVCEIGDALVVVNLAQYPPTTDPTQHARYAGTPGLMAASANGLSDAAGDRSPSPTPADWEPPWNARSIATTTISLPYSCNEGV